MNKEGSMSRTDYTQMPAARQAAIYALAQQKGVVKVADLAEEFGVTEMTIRRDLEVLERKGLLERAHGHAICNAHIGLEPLYVQKSALHQGEKAAIGRLAASLINRGDTVFVNSGSTTIQFLEQLDIDAKIVTNNPLAPIHIRSPKLEVYLTGGELRQESLTLVGESTIRSIKEIIANKAVVGVDGFSIRYGLTNPTQAESWVNRLMVKRTHGEVILVADSSKLGRVANFQTAPISAVNTIVTDSAMDPANVAEFKRLGIRVLIADVDPKPQAG